MILLDKKPLTENHTLCHLHVGPEFLCTWQNLINTSPICITVVLLPTTKHCSVLCLLCSSRLISLPLEALYTRLRILFTPAQSIGLILVWWYFNWPVQTEASCPARGGTFVTLRTFLGSLYIPSQPPNLPLSLSPRGGTCSMPFIDLKPLFLLSWPGASLINFLTSIHCSPLYLVKTA